jgi:hypothetical protein
MMLLERIFESRHEKRGFASDLMIVFEHPDMPHVRVNTICVTGALLSHNLLHTQPPDRKRWVGRSFSLTQDT